LGDAILFDGIQKMNDQVKCRSVVAQKR